jgi:hypothetical protein
LGDNISALANYYVNRGMRPSPGLSLNVEYINMYQYIDGHRSSMFRLADISFSPFVKSIYKNYMDIGLGAEIEYCGRRPVVDYLSFDRINDGFFNVFFFSELDTRNSLYYSTSGTYFLLSGKMIKGITHELKQVPVNWLGVFRWEQSIPMGGRFTVRPAIALVASTPIAQMPIQYKAYLGSIDYRALPGLTPFMGVSNMAYNGSFSYVGRADLQLRVYKQRGFVIATLNAGIINSDFGELFKIENLKIGYGLTAAYKSFVGPLSVTITGNDRIKDTGVFLNIGYKL